MPPGFFQTPASATALMEQTTACQGTPNDVAEARCGAMHLTPWRGAGLPAGAKVGLAGLDEAVPAVADGFGPVEPARRRGAG